MSACCKGQSASDNFTTVSGREGSLTSESEGTSLRVVRCLCGREILLLPDVKEMELAVERHLAEHTRKDSQLPATKTTINELRGFLTKQILILAATSYSENANTRRQRVASPGQTPRIFQHDGAGGGIRTHEDLSQRILSPPPCPRGQLAAYLDLARIPRHQPEESLNRTV